MKAKSDSANTSSQVSLVSFLRLTSTICFCFEVGSRQRISRVGSCDNSLRGTPDLVARVRSTHSTLQRDRLVVPQKIWEIESSEESKEVVEKDTNVKEYCPLRNVDGLLSSQDLKNKNMFYGDSYAATCVHRA